MNSKKNCGFIILGTVFLTAVMNQPVFGQEIFIFRPDLEKDPVSREGKITMHGSYFGQLNYPGNFPSYNDLSGPEDRWNYGFKNVIFWGERTCFIAQLITHDDGGKRTKFDWHFSLRQDVWENLVFILGHDSNHDSDHQSYAGVRPYYVNRNYIGFGIPIRINNICVEPFTWFFHHTNQKSQLDYSGNTLKQEYGIRLGAWFDPGIGISIQAISQSDVLFSLGQALQADLIIRIRLLKFLDLSVGTGWWQDISESRLGSRLRFHRFHWGIAIPF